MSLYVRPRFRRHPLFTALCAGGAALLQVGCLAVDPRDAAGDTSTVAARITAVGGPLLTEHRGDDDLLTGGLGAAGLRSVQPPSVADAEAPTAAELRRRAIWTNWRGIADLAPGAHGESYGTFDPVPGREAHALLELDGSEQPHRVMLQLPDAFDAAKPCVLVAASSGSRGVYGAIALAGGWGLPRGCAVIYTDKGAGTDWIAYPDRRGHGLDGRRTNEGVAAFELETAPSGMAFKHAHSGDHPESRWGEHVVQAARWGLQQIEAMLPDEAAYDANDARLIAVGVSNGAGAVLQAAGLDAIDFDAVVAVSPNVWAGEGGRALFDYALEAAQWMPCALQDATFNTTPFARPGAGGIARCASLHAAGMVSASDMAGQAAESLARMRAAGWSDDAMQAGAISTALDLWRAVVAGYASAYLRTGPDDMPCGYRYALLDAEGKQRAAASTERALWWSDTAGIPPGAGVALLDPPDTQNSSDPSWPGLRCLAALRAGTDRASVPLDEAMQATRAARPPADLPVYLLHGAADGLVPLAFSSKPYAEWVQRAPNRLQVTWIERAQHFDAFVALPMLQGRYRALMPEAYAALETAWTASGAD